MLRLPRFGFFAVLLPACAAPSETASAPTDTRADGLPADLGERLRDGAHGFGVDGAAFVAQVGELGLQVRLDEAGVGFTVDGAPLRLGLPEVAGVPTAAVPVLGACGGLVDPSGECLPRVEYGDAGVATWWVARAEGVEQGFDLATRPDHTGALRIVQAVDADVVPVADGLLLVSDDGTWVHVGEAVAYDATGRELSVGLEPDAGGFVLVVDDADATYPLRIDPLYTTAATTLTGPGTSYGFGTTITNAGDVNGDGYDDVAVGAPAYSSYTGRVYVFHGSSSGLSTTASTTLTGPASSSYFGTSLDGGFNSNGDKYADLVVGAPYYDSSRGRAYVYYGSSTGISGSTYTSLTTSSTYLMGSGVAGVPDMDGDGYDEVAVGYPYYNSYAGRVRVFYGSSSGTSTSSYDTVTVSGSGGLGYSLTAGDFNHDGRGDVAAGAMWTSSYAGSAYVFHGSSGGISSSPTTSISGPVSYGEFGFAVSSGDLNGDGYDDLVVGAPTYNNYSYGRAYTFHGSASGVSSTATTSYVASSTGTALGATLSILQDVDADGYDDLALGAAAYSSNTGQLTVYYGSSAGAASTASVTYTGAGSSYYFGAGIAGVDVNGDGRGDLVVGAPGYSSTTGQVYVYLGYGADADGDGYPSDTDCNDANAAIHPGATEVCDASNTDEDCDGLADDADTAATGKVTYYADVDGDGYATTTTTSLRCDATTGWTLTTGDCNDGNASISPAATEVCDAANTDEDCDGLADDADAAASGKTTFYQDSDGDGYGSAVSASRCDASSTWVAANGDCNDTSASISPAATEVCDAANTDEDCDTLVDDADSSVSAATKTVTRYVDADGDGYGAGAAVLFCDPPTSGYSTVATDCNDTASGVNPGAHEACDASNVDEDCDGLSDDADSSATGKTTFYADADGDGYGGATSVSACDTPAGYTATGGDCNDGNGKINPGATEVCDASDVDEDCDGLADDSDPSATGKTTWYTDSDGDGFGGASSTSACNAPSGGVTTSTDCDDGNASVHPGATEVCDAANTDEDCNGKADNDDPAATGKTTWFVDADGDGYGGTGTGAYCDAPSGYTGTAGDCNDGNAAVNPAAAEVCDAANVDEDCDGLADDSDPSATGQVTVYQDLDGDGYGATAGASWCDVPAGYAPVSGDCDDGDAAINPIAQEICDSADTDEDCDGLVDDADPSVADGSKTAWYTDADGDGYGSSTATLACAAPAGSTGAGADCDDGNAAVHPGATEVCDAADTDEDCDGLVDDADASVSAASKHTWYRDGDGDGYAGSGFARACDAPAGYDATVTDCDDADATIHPGADELPGDLVDQDCDGLESCYVDADDDGWRSDTIVDDVDVACAESGEAVASDPGGDCDDGDPAYHPGATEADCADPNDYNCDGSVGYTDADGDGWAACTDCDDGNAAVSPGGTEICDAANEDEDCDGLSDDADPGVATDGMTLAYADLDGDGYGGTTTTLACDTPAGSTVDSTDCDDTRADVSPAGSEVCDGTGTDEDCDGLVNDADPSVDPFSAIPFYTDADGDGYGTDAYTVACSVPAGYAADAGDCDDTAATVNPGATELCDDADVDEDCDGLVDDADDSVDPASELAWSVDADGDGYGDASALVYGCSAPDGSTADASDCDDTDATVFPGGAEYPADGSDGNCDGLELCYTDADGDGWRGDETVESADLDCMSDGLADADVPDGDCDDGDPAFHPDAAESCDLPIDYNCDGSVGYVDGDGDGWAACEECDDGSAAVNPDATEVCDGVDDNCDGSVDGPDASDASTWYADADADGYTAADDTAAGCTAPDGYGPQTAQADCDDGQPAIHPGATETAADGIDEDCDGEELCYTDADGDGFRPDTTSVTPSDDLDCTDLGEAAADADDGDCDDTDATVHPGAEELAGDGIDQDCDGVDLDEEPDTGKGAYHEGGLYGGGGCGCSTGGTAPAAWMGLLLVAAATTRRRR